MLRRPEGVTIQQMREAFGILPHSARATICTTGKKLGHRIEASRAAKGEPLVYSTKSTACMEVIAAMKIWKSSTPSPLLSPWTNALVLPWVKRNSRAVPE